MYFWQRGQFTVLFFIFLEIPSEGSLDSLLYYLRADCVPDPLEFSVRLFARVSFTRGGNTLTSKPYAHKAGDTGTRATALLNEERLGLASDDLPDGDPPL